MPHAGQLVYNPVSGPARKPEWAQLIRRGGDRVAVLFEELRQAVSRIEGLTEELDHGEQDLNRNPRYRVGTNVLFATRIAPGVLEVFMPLDADERERLLILPTLGAQARQAVREALTEGEGFLLRFRLANRAAARRFAKLVILKNTLQQGSRSR